MVGWRPQKCPLLLLAGVAAAGADASAGVDAAEFVSLLQLAPATVLEHARGLDGHGNESRAITAAVGGAPVTAPVIARRGPHPGTLPAETLVRDKQTWLLLELFGAGVFGMDRFFLGGWNIPMGLMKLLWNIPLLGLWSTIDRITIISNALTMASSVTVLDMSCGFHQEHLERAYVLGAIGGIASLVMLGIVLLVGAHFVWTALQGPGTNIDQIALGCLASIAGINLAISFSVPLLALSVPAAIGLAARAMIRACLPHEHSPEPMRINVVKAIGGEHLCVIEADPAWVVVRLKIAIRSVLGVQTQLQRLVYRNRPLLDSEKLNDHLVISRAEYLHGMLAGKREPKIFDVGLMQYQSIPEASPASSADCMADAGARVDEQ
uniref:Ubiquitin-like domain-containing protein n=1 Tax=Alexandrium catenella TaxID=2925 RepID=A0A7S1MSE9_ALECA